MLDKPALGIYHIADSHKRKTHPIRPPALRINRRWAAAAVAAAQDVRADHEVARGVEEAPWADQGIPPCHPGIIRAFSIMSVRASGKRVGDQHSIIRCRVERSPRLIGQCYGAELTARL